MIDLADHATEHAEAIAAANTFAYRKRKGIPPDRWATTRAMYLVADGIEAMNQIIALQTEAMLQMHNVISELQGDADVRSLRVLDPIERAA